MKLSQYSLTDLGIVSLHLSWGAHTLVTPTTLPESTQQLSYLGFVHLWTLNAQNTVDCGTKFRVTGDDAEMVHTFDSKLWDLLHFDFLLIWFIKF